MGGVIVWIEEEGVRANEGGCLGPRSTWQVGEVSHPVNLPCVRIHAHVHVVQAHARTRPPAAALRLPPCGPDFPVILKDGIGPHGQFVLSQCGLTLCFGAGTVRSPRVLGGS